MVSTVMAVVVEAVCTPPDVIDGQLVFSIVLSGIFIVLVSINSALTSIALLKPGNYAPLLRKAGSNMPTLAFGRVAQPSS